MDKKYSPLVSSLLTYGDGRELRQWPNYLELGFRPEHIPDLIEMATDEKLNKGDPKSLAVWAPVHAWRTLAQLKAEDAVEPLTKLLQMFDSDDDDFVGEELPKVFGMIGKKAIPALEKYVFDGSNGLFDRIAAVHGLERIAANDPECREECVSIFNKKLQGFNSDDPTLNGFLVLYLMELKAIESIDLIRQAYEAEAVDLSILGDFEDVEIGFGLKKNREKPSRYSAAIDELNADFFSSNQNHPARKIKIGRNEPCPCGSGNKYKKCCLNKEKQRSDYDNWGCTNNCVTGNL
jgi:hypothetical protein